MSNVQHKYFPPICLLMTKIIIQVSKELKETSINHNFLFPRHLRHLLEGCLLTSQVATLKRGDGNLKDLAKTQVCLKVRKQSRAC